MKNVTQTRKKERISSMHCDNMQFCLKCGNCLYLQWRKSTLQSYKRRRSMNKLSNHLQNRRAWSHLSRLSSCGHQILCSGQFHWILVRPSRWLRTFARAVIWEALFDLTARSRWRHHRSLQQDCCRNYIHSQRHQNFPSRTTCIVRTLKRIWSMNSWFFLKFIYIWCMFMYNTTPHKQRNQVLLKFHLLSLPPLLSLQMISQSKNLH